eukprot:386128_1
MIFIAAFIIIIDCCNTHNIDDTNLNYPYWLSPTTWNGTFSIPGLNASGSIQFCYDSEKMRFTKNFTYNVYQGQKTEFSLSLIFINNTEYMLCHGPNNCHNNMEPGQCSKYALIQFPFGQNQFENYTIVGTVNVYNTAVQKQQTVNQYVGDIIGYPNGPFATIQYFDPTNLTHQMGNIYIDEFAWYTEIRWFDTIQSGVNQKCFNLFKSCNDIIE